MASSKPSLTQTPSQTVGPYFAYGMLPREYGYAWNSVVGNTLVTDDDTPGERIELAGTVYDGAGDPVVDALIEIWQPNAAGFFDHPADDRTGKSVQARFHGFGRCGTDTEGRFGFHTIKPGALSPAQAPHINVIVMMRGILVHGFTRIYFADEVDANAADPVLQSVPKERQASIVCELDAVPTPRYRFDIHMQGDAETVFFDV